MLRSLLSSRFVLFSNFGIDYLLNVFLHFSVTSLTNIICYKIVSFYPQFLFLKVVEEAYCGSSVDSKVWGIFVFSLQSLNYPMFDRIFSAFLNSTLLLPYMFLTARKISLILYERNKENLSFI